MLTLWKRHSKTCMAALKLNKKLPAAQRRFFKTCNCACWVTGKHPTIPEKYIKESLGSTSWEAAEKLKLAIETGTPSTITAGQMTIAAALNAWVEDRGRVGVAEATLEANHAALVCAVLRYAKHVGITTLQQLDNDRVYEMVTSWDKPQRQGQLGEGWASSTQVGHLSRLRGFFKFAIKREWLTKNHALNVDPPQPEDEQVEPFTPEEEARILAALDGKWWDREGVNRSMWSLNPATLRCLTHVLRDTGLRISDAIRVRPEIVRHEQDGSGIVTMQQWKLDGKFSKGEHREVTVYLEPETVAELCKVPRLGKKYVFMADCEHEADRDRFKQHVKSEVMGCWYVYKKVIGKAANVEDCRPHRFRHTFAVKKLVNGWALADVSRLLGHKGTRTTEKHYAKWTNERQETLKDKIRREREARLTIPALRRKAG